MPDRGGEAPDWGMRQFPRGERAGRWEIVASGDPEGDDALPIRSDARILAATVRAGETVTYEAVPARHQYLVATGGRIRINGQEANPRDGIAITGADGVVYTGTSGLMASSADGLLALTPNGISAPVTSGIAITGEEAITVEAIEDCELVMVDAR